MKTGIVILIYVALFIFVVYEISKHYKEICECQQYDYESKLNEKNEEIKRLNTKLEEYKDNEEITNRVLNMNYDKVKEEYNKKIQDYKIELNEKLDNIENILKSYGNPILAITKVKSILGGKYEN